MTYKSTILDEKAFKKAVVELASRLAEYNANGDLYLLCINERADSIGKSVAGVIKTANARPVITINSKLFNAYKDSPPPFKLPTKTSIVIITDVVHTGSTVKAIVNGFKKLSSNPVQLLTMVIHSELTLEVGAIFSAVKTKLEHGDVIKVSVEKTDGKDGVELYTI